LCGSGNLVNSSGAASGALVLASEFGKYKLLRRLAVGGMAEVFLAEVRGAGGFRKFVAIKRILPHLSSEKEFISMFFDEARLMARFAHPNIVQIYDLGRVGKSYFLAMEFVKGLTMFRVVNRCAKLGQRIPLDIACRIVSDTCSALDYAHNFTGPDGRPLEIVHRDVSAQNVMLSTDGVVKVLDFGVAKAVGNLSRTRPSWLKGKALYMSPEQIEMHPIDRRSDIFSLGTLLYIMTTMHRPFRGESEYQVMMSIVNQPAPNPREYNPDLPDEIVHIICRALEKDPNTRYQTAGQMREEMEHYLFERRRRVEAGELAEFLDSLLPARRKKTSSIRRVPTRPIPAPAPGVPAVDLGGMEMEEVSADQPILLMPKTRAEPIVLDKPKTPIREVPVAQAPPAASATPTPPRQGVILARVATVSPAPAAAPAGEMVPAGEQPFSALARPSRSPLLIGLFAVLAVVAVVVGVWLGLGGGEADTRPTDGGGAAPATTQAADAGATVATGARATPASPAAERESIGADKGSAVSRTRPRRRRGRRKRRPRTGTARDWSRAEPEIEIEDEAPARRDPLPATAGITPAPDAGVEHGGRESARQPAAAPVVDAGVSRPPPAPVAPVAGKSSIPPATETGVGKIAAAGSGPGASSRVKPPPLEEVPPPPPPVEKKPVFQSSARVKARRLSGREPEYPRIARQARLQATLVVKIFISPQGRVERMRFLKTHEAFERAVRKAVSTWRFSPYLVGGRPVATYTVYKFVFKLD